MICRKNMHVKELTLMESADMFVDILDNFLSFLGNKK